ncbi:MAG TPA: hypothetical protein VIL83_03145 [Capillibacterium sp.]
MKRIVASLLALLMLVTFTPVVMAANFDFTGEIETTAEYGKEFGGTSEIELKANLGKDLKAGLSFGSLKDEFPWNGWPLTVKGLWLETKGALIPGTPEFTTRIGTLNVDYSDFVANEISTTGISVDQLTMGPVTVGGYYSLNQSEKPDRGAYVKVNPLAGVEAQATVVKAEDQLSYALSTSVQPVEQAEIAGTYAAVQEGEKAYRVNGKYQVLEGLEVRAGYQDVPLTFNPAHMEDDKDVLEAGTGYTVGATANQFGFELTADYADYDKTVDYSVTRTISLAGMDFDTELAGDYNFDTAKASELEATVSYNAPNGLELSVGYDLINNQPKVAAGLDLQF